MFSVDFECFFLCADSSAFSVLGIRGELCGGGQKELCVSRLVAEVLMEGFGCLAMFFTRVACMRTSRGGNCYFIGACM